VLREVTLIKPGGIVGTCPRCKVAIDEISRFRMLLVCERAELSET